MDGIKPASLYGTVAPCEKVRQRKKELQRFLFVSFFFSFFFSFYFYEKRTQQPAKRAGDVLVFTASRPLAVLPKTFLPPPSHSFALSPPPQQSINVTSPSPCPAPPRDFLFFHIGFAFSFFFTLFFISHSLKAAIRSSVTFKSSVTPRVGEVIHRALFHFHHIFLIGSPGLDFGINPCVSSGAQGLLFFLSFGNLVKNK